MNYQQSEKIDALAKALASAQGEMPPVAKRGYNPHFKSQYVLLDDILTAVKPVLARHGLSVLQFPLSENGEIGVRTLLLHTSGQYISSSLLIKPVKAGSQEIGSISSYFRRYSIGAMLGIPTEEDDDGNSSSPAPVKAIPPPPPPSPKKRLKPAVFDINDIDDLEKLEGYLGDKGIPKEFWERIAKALDGKAKTEIVKITEELTGIKGNV